MGRAGVPPRPASRYALPALTIAVVNAAGLAALWLVAGPGDPLGAGWMALAAAVVGVASTAICLGVAIPALRRLSWLAEGTLLELAQPEHPLLRRLEDEAPGTYHHSILVGALAERAARAIGADALLAKVGAYYHDIGKLTQPAVFIENSFDGGPSPHDAMDAFVSTDAIRRHVPAGLDLARRYRLPPTVSAFIAEHHGTGMVSYFYRQAFAADPTLDPERFRYAGPVPQTRETAIVMLADSCEAAVRAGLQGDRRPIETIVAEVLADRLGGGQLDDSGIREDLQLVAASFTATLKAIHHPRIPYPAAPAPNSPP